jgi:hypothetical protein
MISDAPPLKLFSRCRHCLACYRWRGVRPRGRLTFFAGAKKVSKESTFNTHAVAAAAADRFAPGGGAQALAQQALDRAAY